MRRVLTVLAVVALAPLLVGSGGNPGLKPNNAQSTGPAVSAVFVMDPYQPVIGPSQAFTTTGQATIRVKKGTTVAGALFVIGLPLFLGCDMSFPNDPGRAIERFVNTPIKNNKLSDWIPCDVLTELFTNQLGILIGTGFTPIITDVDNVVCTPDPFPTLGGGPPNPHTGILSFDAVIQFQFTK